MHFIAESKALLNRLPPLTGDSARLAHRLSRALEIIESDRAAMRAAHSDLMKRYDAQAVQRLANQLQHQG